MTAIEATGTTSMSLCLVVMIERLAASARLVQPAGSTPQLNQACRDSRTPWRVQHAT
jgi:hypothetical protein